MYGHSQHGIRVGSEWEVCGFRGDGGLYHVRVNRKNTQGHKKVAGSQCCLNKFC